MKRVIASAAGVALMLSGLVAATPAIADSHHFVNPEATASTTDLDIASVDLDHSEASVRMTVNVENLTLSTYSLTFYVAPTAVAALSSSSDEYLAQVDIVNDAPIRYYVTHYSGNATPPQPLSTADVAFSRSGDALTLDLPRDRLPWTGAVFVAGKVGDDAVRAYAGTRTGGQLVGFGPVYAAARQTSLALTLSASTQGVRGAVVTVTATVSPANAPGAIAFSDGGTLLAVESLSGGTASYGIPSNLTVGTHSISARYVPSGIAWTASDSSVLPLAVTGVATSVKLKLSKSVQHRGKFAAKVSITVSGSKTGKVYLYDGKKRLKALKLKKGKANYTLSKKLKHGKHRLRVLFVPTNAAVFARSVSATKVLSVKR